MPLVAPEAEAYAHQHTTPLSDLLNEVVTYTVQHHPLAHMLSGATQGAFLQLLSQTLQPQYILEIGTFTGFSALCLAAGLLPQGQLHTIELRSEDAATAKLFFERSQYREQLILHTGNAIDIIPTLPHSWDLVFIDADKVGYIDYYEMVLPQLKQNGLIIADNVLFHGQILQQPLRGKNAKAIHAFNQHVANDTRTEQVLLTIRDGLLIIKKK
ncbi:MAG: O-methyltransferase [Chitinophagaceae bacterium]|jgi:predicted O-methyltransferase YrrM